MKFKVLLTLDLKKDTSSDERKKFYDYLESQKWVKIDNLTTAWRCSFLEKISKEDAIKIVKADLKKASKESGVSSYNYAFQIGDGSVVVC